MFVKVTLQIEIDETEFPNLKQSEIKRIVKEIAAAGHTVDYIKDSSKSELDEASYNKTL